MYEEFMAQRIAQLRTNKKVSARDMSLSLGHNRNYIDFIENGKALPSMQTFFYICEYFGITPEEFFHTKDKLSLQQLELTKEISGLSEGDTMLMLELLRRISNHP